MMGRRQIFADLAVFIALTSLGKRRLAHSEYLSLYMKNYICLLKLVHSYFCSCLLEVSCVAAVGK